MKTRDHPRRRRARSLYPTHEPVAGLSLASRPRTCPAPKARLGGSLFVSRPGSLLASAEECFMPTHKLTPEIITAAIVGFEAQKTRIDDQIAELRAMLSGGTKPTAATTPGPPTSQRRKFSAAARRRMKEAQQRRWAKIRGESEPPALVKSEASKPKRKLSKAGRAAIVGAIKARWDRVRAEAGKAETVPRREGRTGGKSGEGTRGQSCEERYEVTARRESSLHEETLGGKEGTRKGGEESWRVGIATEGGGEGFRSHSDRRSVEAGLQVGRSGEYQAGGESTQKSWDGAGTAGPVRQSGSGR